MAVQAVSRGGAPYGLSFAIEELVAVREWASRRRLVMAVALDRVVDGAEFEEMLLLLTRDRRHRLLTLWRTPGGVVAQAAGRVPAVFGSVAAALGSAPDGARRRWFGGRRD